MIDSIKNTFRDSVNPNQNSLSLAEQDRLFLERVAKKIHHSGLVTPAVFFLEMTKPLSLLGSHALVFFGGGVLHHRDGIVHHQTGGQHKAEQGELIERETKGQNKPEGSNQCNRNCNSGDQGRFPILKKQKENQHHQDHSIAEGVHDSFDRCRDEVGVVVDLLHLHANRHGLLEFSQHLLDTV